MLKERIGTAVKASKEFPALTVVTEPRLSLYFDMNDVRPPPPPMRPPVMAAPGEFPLWATALIVVLGFGSLSAVVLLFKLMAKRIRTDKETGKMVAMSTEARRNAGF